MGQRVYAAAELKENTDNATEQIASVSHDASKPFKPSEGHGITKEQNARLAPRAEVPNNEAPPAAAASEAETAEEHVEDQQPAVGDTVRGDSVDPARTVDRVIKDLLALYIKINKQTHFSDRASNLATGTHVKFKDHNWS
ncbi:hypothetical protein PG984_014741 [Apiospora sp. TS-2023a]